MALQKAGLVGAPLLGTDARANGNVIQLAVHFNRLTRRFGHHHGERLRDRVAVSIANQEPATRPTWIVGKQSAMSSLMTTGFPTCGAGMVATERPLPKTMGEGTDGQPTDKLLMRS